MISLAKLIILSSSLFIIGCSESATTEAPVDTETKYTDSVYDDSAQAAEEAQIAEAAPTYSGQEFYGNPCIGDCSGHEAGYQWAEDNGIDDPDTCGGNSDSFIEGCQSYAEEQQ